MTTLVVTKPTAEIDWWQMRNHWFFKQTVAENDTRLDLGPMNPDRIRTELKIIETALLVAVSLRDNPPEHPLGGVIKK